MKIVWSPLSVERISEIAEYISIDNPKVSNNWVETLFGKVEQLKSFPQSGRIVPELGENTIRELIFGNYRIIYRIELRQISILTVRHIRQILPESDLEPNLNNSG
ncbi:MAG: type II toxin-antitoxin system RelE/ParE family toxin [Candidatus Marinimicrobia bacterium]|nr:type II toxin-antitoxin system RelE/ParE family toxin [Candidatus Neomarinimicrobiota bacterium]